MGIFDDVSAKVSQFSGGGGGGVGALIQSGAETIGGGILKSRVPAKMGPMVGAAMGAFGDAMKGDWSKVASRAINSGIFTAKLPWLDGAAAAGMFHAMPSRAMGGLPPLQAKQIMQETLETHFGHKNLFVLDVKLPNGWEKSISMQALRNAAPRIFDFSRAGRYAGFNLFVTDISYGPVTISGDRQKVGSASIDQPTGAEHMDLRITTLDDEKGSVKKWFSALSSLVTRSDGTFGVPADYLLHFTVTHGFVTEESANYWLPPKTGPWSQTALFRPVSMELDLSRKDEGLEEITLVFTQFDTQS